MPEVTQTEFEEKLRRIAEENAAAGQKKYALIETYGCQQNEADSDVMRGILANCGYLPTDRREDADIILFNTCAVREHAELKVFGNVGALKHLKAKKPSLIIGLCGCMMQQEHRAEEVLRKHTQVDFVMGTGCAARLPEILCRVLFDGERPAVRGEEQQPIAEFLPVRRENPVRANLSVMYGCDNFCTYCIVPYVRGRERSRTKEEILAEAQGLIAAGYPEIMLLGQNVNSYGKGLYEDYRFPDLLADLDKLPGNYKLTFMTSHPKDASFRLFDVMAKSTHIAHQLHLPVQSGSDRILKAMNRRYTAADYEKLVAYAREVMPDLTLTSDIIVGFPGETEEDYAATVNFIRRIGYDGLFTFIYSRRRGTPAATMEGQIDKEEKTRRLTALIEAQAEVAKEKNAAYIGKTIEVVVSAVSATDEKVLAARSTGGKLVHFEGGAELVGKTVTVTVDRVSPYALYAHQTEK